MCFSVGCTVIMFKVRRKRLKLFPNFLPFCGLFFFWHADDLIVGIWFLGTQSQGPNQALLHSGSEKLYS